MLEEIGPVVREGIPTVKTFMTSGWMVDDGYRWGIMQAVAAAGGMSVVHAEDDAIATWLTKKYLREGKTHGACIVETRNFAGRGGRHPPGDAAGRTRRLRPVHPPHGGGQRRAGAGRGTRPRPALLRRDDHPYLSFTGDALWDDERRGLLWNNYPTPKYQQDQDLPWQALADGRLQTVGSDHFATSVADHYDKLGITVDRMQAGHANVELRLPVIFHLFRSAGPHER